MFSYIFITIVVNRDMTIFIVSEVRVKTLLAPSLQIHVRQIPCNILEVQDKMSTGCNLQLQILDTKRHRC